LAGDYLGDATLHPLSIECLTPAQCKRTNGPVLAMEPRINELSEELEPFAPESRPGTRLMDLFPTQVVFDLYLDLNTPPADESVESIDPLEECVYLDTLLEELRGDPDCIYRATDASRPLSNKKQAVASCYLLSRLAVAIMG